MNVSSIKRAKYAMDYIQAKKVYETMDNADILANRYITPIMNAVAAEIEAEIKSELEHPEGIMYEFFRDDKKIGIATVDIDIQGAVNIRVTKVPEMSHRDSNYPSIRVFDNEEKVNQVVSTISSVLTNQV